MPYALTARVIVDEHIATLEHQLLLIIIDGMATGEFASVLDPPQTAKAFFYAIAKFPHPALVQQTPVPGKAEADAVLGLLLTGLRHGLTTIDPKK